MVLIVSLYLSLRKKKGSSNIHLETRIDIYDMVLLGRDQIRSEKGHKNQNCKKYFTASDNYFTKYWGKREGIFCRFLLGKAP